ncbi:TPA: hypothetical protein HA318_00655 [Candidatus Micrarchaeota archaeon]|nr:hypothetical protein [Candidatus Micrarchaeota archaeon]
MAILTFVLALAFVATAGAAEVRIASEISAGSHNAYVFEAGAPASGSVDFVSPSGDVFARELDSNGAAEFYFDSVGAWNVRYGNVSAKTEVTQAMVFASSGNYATPITLQSASKETAIKPVAAELSLFSSDSFLWPALFFALLGATAWYFFGYSVLKISKKATEDKVTIIVENRGPSLKEVILTDVAPEGTRTTFFSEVPEVSETVLGNCFRWKKALLRNGEAWKISYKLQDAKGVLRNALIVGTAVNGRVFKAASTELELD